MDERKYSLTLVTKGPMDTIICVDHDCKSQPSRSATENEEIPIRSSICRLKRPHSLERSQHGKRHLFSSNSSKDNYDTSYERSQRMTSDLPIRDMSIYCRAKESSTES